MIMMMTNRGVGYESGGPYFLDIFGDKLQPEMPIYDEDWPASVVVVKSVLPQPTKTHRALYRKG